MRFWLPFFIGLVFRAVARRNNWRVYIHIFMFTYRKNIRFQKKSAGQNTNIWICPPPPPPPNYRSSYGPARICSFFLHLVLKTCQSTAKSLIFQNMKNFVHTCSRSHTVARWSWITFFLYTLYKKLQKHTLIPIYCDNEKQYRHMF